MAGKSAALEHAVGKMALGFAAAGVAIGVESVRAAAKFQTAMELIHTQAGRSQATVNQMSKAVLALAGPTATAPEELAKGLYHLASTGLSAAKTMNALKIAAEGAKLGGADLESVTNALNATIVSGIKGSGDFSKAMGALNAVVGAGDMRMQDLAEAMGTGVLTTAKNFGVSLNSVGAALAVFGDNNIRGADAATKLSQSITYLEKPAAGANKVLKTIGLTTKQLRADMGSGGFGKTLADLHDHLVKAGDTGTKLGPILLDIFGRKPANAINTLLGEYQRFQTKQEEVSKGSKNFASDWSSYTQTFGYSWDRAKTSFESMTIQIGQKLLPTATKAMNWIGTTGVADVEKFSGWVSRNKRPIEDIAKVLATIAAFRFASSKLNDISRILGIGGKGALGGKGGGLLGAASKADPVPVFVTNEGFGGGKGGPGVVGTGERAGATVARTALGDAKTAVTLARAGQLAEGARVGLRAVARSPIDPLTVLALAVLDRNKDPRKSEFVGNDFNQRLAHSTVGQQKQASTSLMHLQNLSSFPGTGTGAVKNVLQFGSKEQINQLGALAQKNKAVAAALQDVAVHAKSATSAVKNYGGESGKSTLAAIAAARSLDAAEAQATHNVVANLRKIPGALTGLAAQMKAGGLSIGAALDAGLTVGIKSGAGQVQFVTSQVVQGVLHRARSEAAVKSPSKKTIYIGRMLAEGLGIGMDQGGKIAVTKAQNLLNKVTSKLDAARGNAAGLASGIAGNLTGGASLSNMPLASTMTGFGTSGTAAPTMAGMTSFLTSYLAREKKFRHNLAIARKKGLSAVDASNIAQMGLDVGGPIAAALAGSTSAQVRHISALDAQITSTSNALGSTIAKDQYGAEIARLLKQQNGLLAALAHKTGVEVANAMKSPHSAKTLATGHTRAQRAK